MFNELSSSETKRWSYPGGERGVRSLGKIPESIVWRIQNSNDLLDLLLLSDSVQRKGEQGRDSMERIYIPYMPYARQDRVAAEGDPCSISLVASLISSVIWPKEVHTLDIHSEMAKKYLSGHGYKLINHSPVPYIKKFLSQLGVTNPTFVSPDAGAQHKVSSYAKEIPSINGVIQCIKKRDPDTGKLCGFGIDGYTHQATPTSLVIVDDICDGGGTFLGLADVLKAEYPGVPIYLFISHAIYSQGLDKLSAVFEKIGSTDSFLHGLTHDKLLTTKIDFSEGQNE